MLPGAFSPSLMESLVVKPALKPSFSLCSVGKDCVEISCEAHTHTECGLGCAQGAQRQSCVRARIQAVPLARAALGGRGSLGLEHRCVCPVEEFFFVFFFGFFLLLISRERERERERGKNIDLLFHLHIHWLSLVCALTGERTHALGVSGPCSNRLSCAARVFMRHVFMIPLFFVIGTKPLKVVTPLL